MTPAAFTQRTEAGVVVVSGADARAFLQDMISQHVADLGPGQGAETLFLQPTGKMGIRFHVLIVDGEPGEEWWMTTDEGFGPGLAEAISRFVLRVDVQVENRSDRFGVVSLRGEGARAIAEQAAGVAVPGERHAHAEVGEIRVVRRDWPDIPGVDFVGPIDALHRLGDSLRDAGAEEWSADEFETQRIAAGVPRMGLDLDDSVIPQEAGLDRTAVSFDKGCFLGQELVCRIHDRGRVNRHLRRLRVRGAEPPAGSTVVRSDDDKEVGALTSVAAASNGETLALGYVRHEVEPGSEVTVRWPDGEAEAVVEEIPVV